MGETQILTIKLRLRDKHEGELNRQARAVNFVWNYCNDVQRQALRWSRHWPTAYDLMKLTSGTSTALGIGAGTINRVCSQYEASRRLLRSRMLRWRGKRSLGWIPYKPDMIRFDGRHIYFRSARFEPMHLHPALRAGVEIKNGSFNADARGRWYVNLSISIECAATANRQSVGLDLGLKSLATRSDGAVIVAPRFYRQSERAIAGLQRARKTRRAASIHRKIANRRKDFLHKASRALADEFGLIVVGDVSPKRLARTTMAKSINDAGWSMLRTYLSYKTHLRGGRLVQVNEAYTTQVCSACGSMPSSRPKGIADLGIREWCCDDCGTVHDRDVNAARNILRLGLETLVEGAPTLMGSSQPLERVSPQAPDEPLPLPPNHEGGR